MKDRLTSLTGLKKTTKLSEKKMKLQEVVECDDI